MMGTNNEAKQGASPVAIIGVSIMAAVPIVTPIAIIGVSIMMPVTIVMTIAIIGVSIIMPVTIVRTVATAIVVAVPIMMAKATIVMTVTAS